MSRQLAVAALLTALVACGCLKRTEFITVFPDGSVHLITQIAGDPDDVANGDAMPAEESDWHVSERIETDDEGKGTLIRMAHRRAPVGQACPTSYAPAGSPAEEYVLRFPTSVTVERGAGGVYYHFRRTYHARLWARIEYWRKRFLETDEIKGLGEKAPEELTDEDRSTLARALICFEGEKTADFVDQSMENVTPAVPQDTWLKARQAARQVYDVEKLTDTVTALLKDEDVGHGVKEVEQDLQKHVLSAVRTALSDGHVSADVTRRILDGYHLARTAHQVTEDLGDEDWEVKVYLPGKIIAHDSSEQEKPDDFDPAQALDELSEEPEVHLGSLITQMAELDFKPGFQSITWSFNGKALYDRDVTLMATSFVAQE